MPMLPVEIAGAPISPEESTRTYVPGTTSSPRVNVSGINRDSSVGRRRRLDVCRDGLDDVLARCGQAQVLVEHLETKVAAVRRRLRLGCLDLVGERVQG